VNRGEKDEGEEMPVDCSDMVSLVENIWATAIGLEVVSLEGDSPASLDGVVGCVQITGDWTGAVTVHLSDVLARTAASVMLEMAEDELSEADVKDVVGEIANMTGGNFKGILPGSCRLSLPAVAAGSNFSVEVPGTVIAGQAHFKRGSEQLTVVVFEQLLDAPQRRARH
jgi:chemotaxis protein CheX